MTEYIEREALIKLCESKRIVITSVTSAADAIRTQGKVFREAVDECPAVDVAPIADTVRKMQERLKEELNNVARWQMHGDSNEYYIIGKAFIDQIAEEMLKGEEQ